MGKNSSWNIAAPHPAFPGEKLYFMPDVCHVLKNIKAAICNGMVIVLPPEVVKSERLPINEVRLEHFKMLAEFDDGNVLKLAPILTKKILEPSHFEKMSVGMAMHMFSHATASALRHLVAHLNYPKELLATAWFVERLSRWFDFVNSRSITNALSRKNHPDMRRP